jgi:hypothetical protein
MATALQALQDMVIGLEADGVQIPQIGTLQGEVIAALEALGLVGTIEHAIVARTTNQSIPNATLTIVSWESELFDNGNFFNILSPTLFTISTAGHYLILAEVTWFTSPGAIVSRFLLNGATVIQGLTAGSGAALSKHSILNIGLFNATDTLALQVQQNSGGALNFEAALGNFFAIIRLD